MAMANVGESMVAGYVQIAKAHGMDAAKACIDDSAQRKSPVERPAKFYSGKVIADVLSRKNGTKSHRQVFQSAKATPAAIPGRREDGDGALIHIGHSRTAAVGGPR